MTASEMESQALRAWNPSERPSLHTWLSSECGEEDQARLKAVGNMVIPQCGKLALHLLEHSMREELAG